MDPWRSCSLPYWLLLMPPPSRMPRVYPNPMLALSPSDIAAPSWSNNDNFLTLCMPLQDAKSVIDVMLGAIAMVSGTRTIDQ